MKKYKARIRRWIGSYDFVITVDKTSEITNDRPCKTISSAKRAAERVAKKLGITLEWKT